MSRGQSADRRHARALRRAVAAVSVLLAAAAAAAASSPFAPSIVNGTPTAAYPTTGILVMYDDASLTSFSSFCSGTLVGCETFVVAAHCVCPDMADSAATCQEFGGLTDPATMQVFLPHAGFVPVSHVAIDPDYVFAQTGDVAVITLGVPVTGIAPSPINTLHRLDAATAGVVVGFGTTNGSRRATDDSGIKRQGPISTAMCTGDLPDATLICWNFLGPGASTCSGDSGGPLFVDFGSGAVLAGVTSGGNSFDCSAPDTPFDTDVLLHSAWIASQAGADLRSTACGTFAPVGVAPTTVLDSGGQISAAQPEARWAFTVPPGTSVLRVALNGQFWSGPSRMETGNDFDLYVRAGSSPTTSQYDCHDANPTPLGFCEIPAPAAGTWSVLVNQTAGEGAFQLTATALAAPVSSCAGDCNGDGQVTINDLLVSVGVALGTSNVSVCRACDLNGDGTISVDELLVAVNNALSGCR